MIRKILKWLYLIISGMSFLMVLCLIAFCGYAYLAEDDIREYISDFQEYQEYQKNEKIFEVIDVDENMSTVYAMNTKNNTKQSLQTIDPKIKIKTKSGYAYLRPSQIYYVESGDEFHTIKAINGKEIQLNKRESPLKQIDQLLSKYSCFYATKSFIINCSYIEQIKRNNEYRIAKKFVFLENGDSIQLPENHVNPLIKLLDQIHETN